MPIPLICDSGLFVNMAARMALDSEVAYFSQWGNAFPTSREIAPGTGIKNIVRVNDPISFMLDGQASMVIVPDLYLDGYARLARALDLPTFATNGGDSIETDRWELKQLLEKHGLPVNETVEILGVDALREYLEKREDLYIKVSVFRGDMETYHHVNWARSYMWWVGLCKRFGAIGNKVRFLVEVPIPDAVEVGVDTFFRAGRWVEPFFVGPEIKDGGYAGMLVERMAQLPKEVGAVMDVVGAYAKERDYNCFFSNEMRIRGDEVFMTDATCRIPSPPGGVMMAAMKNFTAFVMRNEAPDYSGRWVCEIVLKTLQADDDWVEFDIPPSMQNRVMLHNYCVVDGRTWVIPHDSKYVEVASACGWAANLKDAAAMALETAKAVSADGLYFDDHVLDKAEKEFEKLG